MYSTTAGRCPDGTSNTIHPRRHARLASFLAVVGKAGFGKPVTACVTGLTTVPSGRIALHGATDTDAEGPTHTCTSAAAQTSPDVLGGVAAGAAGCWTENTVSVAAPPPTAAGWLIGCAFGKATAGVVGVAGAEVGGGVVGGVVGGADVGWADVVTGAGAVGVDAAAGVFDEVEHAPSTAAARVAPAAMVKRRITHAVYRSSSIFTADGMTCDPPPAQPPFWPVVSNSGAGGSSKIRYSRTKDRGPQRRAVPAWALADSQSSCRSRSCSLCRADVRTAVPGRCSPSGTASPVRRVHLGTWGVVELFDVEEQGDSGSPALPAWLPREGPYRAARLHMLVLPNVSAVDMIAVWPDDAAIPDLRPADLLGAEEVAQMLLVRAYEHFRCRACGRPVYALYPDLGLPSNRPGRHRFATHCPHCRAHVDAARLHALALFPADGRHTAPPAGG